MVQNLTAYGRSAYVSSAKYGQCKTHRNARITMIATSSLSKNGAKRRLAGTPSMRALRQLPPAVGPGELLGGHVLAQELHNDRLNRVAHFA